MNSHHDAILSMFTLPISIQQQSSTADLLVAPKLDHQRTRITWSDQGIQDYSTVVSGHLRRIRNTWMDPSSQASMSVLLQLTNSIMVRAASLTNESKVLSKKTANGKKKIPDIIKKARNKLNKFNRKFKLGLESIESLKKYRKAYHQTVRTYTIQADIERDTQLYSIMGENPGKVFSFIKSTKANQSATIAKHSR